MRALDCRCEENDGNEALDKAGISVEKRALPFLALTALRVMRVTPREENIVDVGDNDTVARHMFELYTNDDLYDEMCEYARTHVSDEVGTVGNAAAWMYLAVMYCSRGVRLQPKGAWLNDLMRAETGEPYAEAEPRLPRSGLNVQG